MFFKVSQGVGLDYHKQRAKEKYIIRWTFPLNDWVKFNVDVSVKSTSYAANYVMDFARLFGAWKLGFNLQEVRSSLHYRRRDIKGYFGIEVCLEFGGEEGLC